MMLTLMVIASAHACHHFVLLSQAYVVLAPENNLSTLKLTHNHLSDACNHHTNCIVWIIITLLKSLPVSLVCV